MKKRFKLLTCALASAACIASASALGGCLKTKTVSGEMHYNSWGTEYGIKVEVVVQNDKKGDRIRKLTVVESDYVEASPAMNGWDPKVWEDNLQTLLTAYRGAYVADILALDVATGSSGAPLTTGDAGFNNFGGEYIITDATLGSARLLLAVQDALSKL
ncbi:MAG: hypothetical protein K2O44_04855 [Clostridia bacterium]|nr:hypothetical protein [Clostridia bacterium]